MQQKGATQPKRNGGDRMVPIRYISHLYYFGVPVLAFLPTGILRYRRPSMCGNAAHDVIYGCLGTVRSVRTVPVCLLHVTAERARRYIMSGQRCDLSLVLVEYIPY